MQACDILYAMELSGVAYHDIQPVFPTGSLSTINDPLSDVQCYFRRTGATLYITFRGSNSSRDWRHNLTFCKKTVPYDNAQSKIRVHAGFLEAYQSPGVRSVIHSMISPGIAEIRISGHSLGAALAILCGVDLEYNFPDRDYEVAVFGCPRVGNRAFRDSYNKRVFKTLRIENGNDIVTKLPPAVMGYRHVGQSFHIGRIKIPGIVSPKNHEPSAYYKELAERFW